MNNNFIDVILEVDCKSENQLSQLIILKVKETGDYKAEIGIRNRFENYAEIPLSLDNLRRLYDDLKQVFEPTTRMATLSIPHDNC